MNLIDVHDNKGVSAKPISQSIASKVIAIQILTNELLKEHITKIPAVLFCVLGKGRI